MKFLRSKIAVGVLCFALGTGSILLGQKIRSSREYRLGPPLAQNLFDQGRLLDSFFNDDFFGTAHDPFEDMRKMRERMTKQFGEDSRGGGIFDSWYQKKFGGNAGEVQKREDNKYIYYDIFIHGLDQDKVRVKVADGQVTISGQQEKKSEDRNAGTFFSSSFYRSFPVPSNVDADHVEMEQDKTKLVVKFPKSKL